ncbi:hypothetical protein D3C84_650820 [compost metagenome]
MAQDLDLAVATTLRVDATRPFEKIEHTIGRLPCVLARADHRTGNKHADWGRREQIDVNIDIVGKHVTNFAGYQIVDLAGGHIFDIDRPDIGNENVALIIDGHDVGEVDGTPDPDIQLIPWCDQVIVIQAIAAFSLISPGKQVGAIGRR